MSRLINPHLGDLLDRASILELKISRYPEERTAEFKTELDLIWNEWMTEPEGIPVWAQPLYDTLQKTNATLWAVEDQIRNFRTQARAVTDPDLLVLGRLAMQAQDLNDERARLIARLNEDGHSDKGAV